MKTRTKVALSAAALLVATGIGFGLGNAQVFQPHMQNALNDLILARGELKVAATNKGGYRVAALARVNQAITNVQAGIAVGNGM